MKSGNLMPVLRQLYARSDDLSDGELLDRFRGGREESAFTLLVQRHGPMVLGVCRRVLHNADEADDAFQATFLVLVRKASLIRKQQSLGSWLHSVAYRTAVKARVRARRRRTQEQQASVMPRTDSIPDITWSELRNVLDDELDRLPEKYRAPVVLCYLEGKSQEQAAAELGCPKSSLASRLGRARALLHGRLSRRGFAFSAGAVAGLLAEQSAAAALPATLVLATVRAAGILAVGNVAGAIAPQVLALAEGVSRAMTMSQLKVVTGVLFLLGGLVAGAGALAHPLQSDAPPSDKPPVSTPREEPKTKDAPANPSSDSDRLGDPLPAGAIARLGTGRLRHGGSVLGVAFSPDGKYLASCGGFSDHSVVLWDLASGREVRRLLGHTMAVQSVAFSPDGKLLASGGRDFSVNVWDAATGTKRFAVRYDGAPVNSVSFTADGQKIAFASQDGSVCLVDGAKGKLLFQTTAHNQAVQGLAKSPNGQLLATGSSDKTVKLWNAADGSAVRTLRGHDDVVQATAFSPDGRLLSSAGQDRTIRLWDVAKGEEIRRAQGQHGAVRGVAFAPDGRMLASAGEDATVRLWDVATGREVRRFQGHLAPVCCVAFSPDGKLIATGGQDKENTVRIWDVTTGKERTTLEGHNGWVGAIVLSSDGKSVLSACSDEMVKRWDIKTAKMLGEFRGRQSRGKAIALSPDGQWAATGSNDGKVHLLDVRTGKEVRQLVGHEGKVWSTAFSPDGKSIISGGQDQTIRVWEAATGLLQRQLPRQPDVIWTFAFAPTGRLLVTGGSSGAIRIWDWPSGDPIGAFEGHRNAIEALTFSPDGRLLASGADDRTVRLWDVSSRKERNQIAAAGAVYAAAFSPDGRTLASGGADRLIYFWETATGAERKRLTGHRGAVAALAFTPDGKTLISGSSDSTALVWDLSGSRLGQSFKVVDLTPMRVEEEWKQLAGDNAARAYQAIGVLAATPRQTLPLLQQILQPAVRIDGSQVAQLLADLDHDQFSVREQAMFDLEKFGDAVEGELRKALQGTVSAEVRQRVQRLLGALGEEQPSGARLQKQRALEVLELMDGPEAKQLLEKLAKGAPEAPITRAAEAALKRRAR